MATPRAQNAWKLALWYVLQACRYYLLIFTAISIVAGVLARPMEWLGARFKPFVRSAALAAGVAIAALLPFLLPVPG